MLKNIALFMLSSLFLVLISCSKETIDDTKKEYVISLNLVEEFGYTNYEFDYIVNKIEKHDSLLNLKNECKKQIRNSNSSNSFNMLSVGFSTEFVSLYKIALDKANSDFRDYLNEKKLEFNYIFETIYKITLDKEEIKIFKNSFPSAVFYEIDKDILGIKSYKTLFYWANFLSSSFSSEQSINIDINYKKSELIKENNEKYTISYSSSAILYLLFDRIPTRLPIYYSDDLFFYDFAVTMRVPNGSLDYFVLVEDN